MAAALTLVLAQSAAAQTDSPAMGETTTPPFGANTPAAAGGREGMPPAALNMEGVPNAVRTPPSAREGDTGAPPSNLGTGAIGAPPASREEGVAPSANPRGNIAERGATDREVFTDDTRTAISTHFRSNFERTGACPPGFAKGANTCAPDSHTMRTVRVGQPLPATVTVQPIPAELAPILPAPPGGLVHGYVNGDVILYELDTRKVADSVAVSF